MIKLDKYILIKIFMINWLEKIVWFYDNNNINSVERKIQPVNPVSNNFDSILKNSLKNSDWEPWNKYIHFLIEEWEKLKKDILWSAVYVDISDIEWWVKSSVENILAYNPDLIKSNTQKIEALYA